MRIDLNVEDSLDIFHQDLHSKGNSIRKERIIIPAFDLYSREVGDGNGTDRVKMFAYEIRCEPKNAHMLKMLLCRVSTEYSNFNFIPYGLKSITNSTTTRQIIAWKNSFLEEMAIVPINGIL